MTKLEEMGILIADIQKSMKNNNFEYSKIVQKSLELLKSIDCIPEQRGTLDQVMRDLKDMKILMLFHAGL